MLKQNAARPVALGRDLVLDELLDLTLYQELRPGSKGDVREILDGLIPVETRHLAFWQKFFGISLNRLDLKRRVKLRALVWACRLFGAPCALLVLEAIEVYGVRKYLAVWERYKDTELGVAVREILTDEFEHEDEIVSAQRQRSIGPERISAIFLGFNDGLVEILGAVSGFFAAFHQASMVLMAGFSVAAAGAFSMGAGAGVAAGSGNEIRRTAAAKKRFLGGSEPPLSPDSPLRTGLTVALSYFFGALVPLLPVLIGATGVLGPAVTALVLVIAVSSALAFLSGMDLGRRVLTNVLMVSGAVALSYGIGWIVRQVWGVSL